MRCCFGVDRNTLTGIISTNWNGPTSTQVPTAELQGPFTTELHWHTVLRRLCCTESLRMRHVIKTHSSWIWCSHWCLLLLLLLLLFIFLLFDRWSFSHCGHQVNYSGPWTLKIMGWGGFRRSTCPGHKQKVQQLAGPAGPADPAGSRQQAEGRCAAAAGTQCGQHSWLVTVIRINVLTVSQCCSKSPPELNHLWTAAWNLKPAAAAGRCSADSYSLPLNVFLYNYRISWVWSDRVISLSAALLNCSVSVLLMKPLTCSSVTASVTAALLDSIYVQNANISHIKLLLVADHMWVFVIHKAALWWIFIHTWDKHKERLVSWNT